MNIRQNLKTLILQTFELPDSTDVEGLKYRVTKGWDSVGHMRLVAALETEFNILLETDQILDFSNFDVGLDILKAHGISD